MQILLTECIFIRIARIVVEDFTVNNISNPLVHVHGNTVRHPNKQVDKETSLPVRTNARNILEALNRSKYLWLGISFSHIPSVQWLGDGKRINPILKKSRTSKSQRFFRRPKGDPAEPGVVSRKQDTKQKANLAVADQFSAYWGIQSWVMEFCLYHRIFGDLQMLLINWLIGLQTIAELSRIVQYRAAKAIKTDSISKVCLFAWGLTTLSA